MKNLLELMYIQLDEAIKLKDKYENAKGKKLLEDLEEWLSKNDKKKNEKYIKEINDTKKLFSEFSGYSFNNQMLYNNLNCCVQNNMFKRMDIYNNNCNMMQMAMINSIPKPNISKSSNQNNLNNNGLNNFNQYPSNMNSAPLFSNMNSAQNLSNMNSAPLFSNMYSNPMMNNMNMINNNNYQMNMNMNNMNMNNMNMNMNNMNNNKK